MRLAGILALLLVVILTHDQPVLVVACLAGVLALVVVHLPGRTADSHDPPRLTPKGSVIEILGPEDDPESLRRLSAQIQREQRGEENLG